MGRTPCCSAEGVKKGAWTSDEDKKLIAYIEKHGEGGWRTLPLNAGLQRCGKSCRLRWTNYLRPGIKRGEFSPEEDQKIIELHATLGNRWSAIAKQLSKRTDNEIKNYWNTHLKKRLTKTAEPKSKPANCTKSSSSTNDQPNSSNHEQNNNANNDTNHSSQDDAGRVSHPTDMDPPQDKLENDKPRSASAKLLNRLATRLPSSSCLDILKDGPLFQSPSPQDKDAVCDSDSRPGSSSARSLLNKMASGINKPTVYLEMVRSVLSKSLDVGTDTSTGEDFLLTNSTNSQTWMQPTTSMSLETAENLASDIMVQDVPSHGVQNAQYGDGSIESLTEELDLDFLQNWTTIMDDGHDNGADFIGGGSYEGGFMSTCANSDRHSIESSTTSLSFVNSFEPESEILAELSDYMNFY